MISFSQSSQDLFVIMYFRGEKGFFVDVGARDGVVNSNSLLLERLGWVGLLFEPDPRFHIALESRKAELVKSAAYSSSGLLEFHSVSRSGYEGRSGVKKHIPQDRLLPGGTIKVHSTTLNAELQSRSVSKIDYLDVDVEGAELEVLKGLSLEQFDVTLIGIEAVTRDEEESIIDYLASFGYENIGKVGSDLFFDRGDWRRCFGIEQEKS